MDSGAAQQVWKARTHAMIARAKALGVQQITLTVRSNNECPNPGQPTNCNADPAVAGNPAVIDGPDYFPSATKYKARIDALVKEFAGEVDFWGPANEPNLKWRPDVAPEGAKALDTTYLAAYYVKMREAVAAYDPTAKVTSPDFTDDGNLTGYINAYLSHIPPGVDGGWGVAAAFHPYRGVREGNLATTNEFTGLVSTGQPIWITEVGSRNDLYGQSTQNSQVNWIINTLGAQSRVTRVFYYQMPGHTSGEDYGLLNPDKTPRPSWKTWCAATHGDTPSNSDCTGYPPPPPWDPSFNGDNKSDLIVADPINERFSVALSTGSSLAGAGGWLMGWGGNPVWAGVGDFNGDNKSDLIGSDPINQRYSVALSTGSSLGAPGTGVWLTNWNGNPPWAGVGDVNGDKKSDLIVADAINARYVVALSTGSSLAGAGAWLEGWGGDPEWADMGDFNGDGKDDLIGSDPVNNRYSVALSSGTQLGASGSGSWLEGWDGSPVWAAAGD
jgi:hypothetical protein